MEQKTVFISYRRAISKHLARSIYMDLRANGWDVFLDVNTIDSGDFDRIILNQIAARAHFILLISKGSLERCKNPGDWLLREIEEAVSLNRNIVPIVEEESGLLQQEISYLPEKLQTIIGKKNALPLPHFYFEEAMVKLRRRFLKTPEYVQIRETPATEGVEVQRRLKQVEEELPSPTRPTSESLMPEPFEWIKISGGSGTMKTNEPGVIMTIPTETYWIAKYPVTRAQFRKFIDAGGYETKKWWTKEGWQKCQEGWHYDDEWERETTGTPWTEPRYGADERFRGNDKPVVGVSWYETVAFCQWLSDTTGEKIMLPTEAQWQYAAQGIDGRDYPWGKKWDSPKCQNSVDSKPGKTSPVTQYEGKGDSYFEVIDTAGNVWEWCLTDYENKTNEINSTTNNRVLRGGSWSSSNSDSFRCGYRNRNDPFNWHSSYGFRVVRLSN